MDKAAAGLWPITNDMIANLHGCKALHRIAVRFRRVDLFFLWMELR
jgi:hypothetical protein